MTSIIINDPQKHQQNAIRTQQEATAARMAEAPRAQPFEIDVQSVDFPLLLGYGYQHSKMTAMHASTMLFLDYGGLYRSGSDEHKAVYLAGFFHDVGRRTLEHDPEHAMRSAEVFERWAKQRSDVTAAVRERAVRLIAHHSKRPENNDPLARALYDADLLEIVRHAPNTKASLLAIQKAKNRGFGDFINGKNATIGDPWLRCMKDNGWKIG